MKIAEALALRADLQSRLEQLKQRLVKNARIQEGDAPAEDPVELQSELEKSTYPSTLHIVGPPRVRWMRDRGGGVGVRVRKRAGSRKIRPSSLSLRRRSSPYRAL